MKFSILLGFFSLLVAAEAGLLGAKECTFGPSFWCGSLRNAKQCNAVKHCIQTVWEKQILPVDNDDICALCKEMVLEARQQLLSNETQEEIREVFEGSCNLIPISLIKKECITLSDEFIPELIETLASQMKPQVVCATAGLCNNVFVDRHISKYKKKHGDLTIGSAVSSDPLPGDCKDCKKFVVDVIETVKRHSRAEVMNHLLAICARLSSLSDGCMALVQANFEDIYIFLTRTLNPDDVCELFGMCSRMYGQTSVSLPKTGDETCDFCVAVVTSWRNNLVSNTSKDEFKMILEGICHQTGSFVNECLSLVDRYFEDIYELLVSEIDPKTICAAVGLCGESSVFKNDLPLWPLFEIRPDDTLPLYPLRPSFDNRELIGQDEANSYKVVDEPELPRVSLSSSSVHVVSAGEKGFVYTPQDSDACVMCEFVLHFLQNVLHDQSTREEIKDAVDKVCQLMPHTVAEECEDYVDAYGNMVIDMISQNIDPSQICPLLKLCPGNKQLQVANTPTCVICEYVMTELDTILKDKSNEETIRETVDSVCQLLPKTVASECKDFVDMYIDQIVDLIVNDFTPRQICQQLGLCNSATNGGYPPLKDAASAQLPVTRYFIPNVFQNPSASENVGKQSAVCVICEFVMTQIDTMILQNSTEKEIEGAINKVCLFLPSTLMNDCLGFMEQYGDSLIEMLVNELDPDFVCRAIDLCHDTLRSSLPVAQVQSPMDKCSVCEKVLTWVGENKEIAKTPAVTEDILYNVCTKIPMNKSKRETCVSIAFDYGESLYKLLDELKDAKTSCQALKMCSYHGKKTLLGAEKCTWGPSYWCQSKLHADSCEATQHCVDNVWKDVSPM